SGKLMTQELNMVEEGMPGFSKAMADHLGVAPDKMREMVTAGEVSSEDFLTVMDGFAGGMAAAYSDSWRGMVANTKAYIGIIGENLLSGVFEKSKESIAEFIEFLKSPEVVAWAERMGQVIGTVFSNIIDRIKSAIAWFTQLSGSQQTLIGILAALATAAGPVLMVLGTLGTAVGAFVFYVGSAISTIGRFGLKFQQLGGFAGVLSNIISKVTGFFARFGGVLRTILGPIMPIITKGFTILRTALMALTGPVGIVIGIVSALVAGFVIAYKRSETFRNFIDGLVQSFLNAIQPLIRFKDMIVSVFKAIFNMFTGDMDGGIKMLEALGLQPEQIGRIISTVQQIQAAFFFLKKAVTDTLGGIRDFFVNTWNVIKNWWTANSGTITAPIVNAFTRAKELIAIALSRIREVFSNAFNGIRAWWSANGTTVVNGIITAFEWMGDTISAVMDFLTAYIRFGFNNLKAVFRVTGMVLGAIWKALWAVISETVKIAWPIVSGILSTGLRFIQSLFQTFAPIVKGI